MLSFFFRSVPVSRSIASRNFIQLICTDTQYQKMASNDVTTDDSSPPAYSDIFNYSQQSQQSGQLTRWSNNRISERDSLPVYTSLEFGGHVLTNQPVSSAASISTITPINTREYLACYGRIENNADRRFKPPRDYFCWSLFNCIFCNVFGFGFVSIYYSLRSMSAYYKMNLDIANKYSRKARRLNQILIRVGACIYFLLMIGLFILSK